MGRRAKEIIEEKINIKGSSLIEFIIYNRKTFLLQVKYKRGKYKNQIKLYEGIVADEYNQVMESHSKGRTLMKVPKKKKEENAWHNRFLRFFNLKH